MKKGRILLPLSLGYKLVTTPLSCCHVIFLCLYKNAFSSSPALRQRRRNPILDKIDCSSNLQKRETLVFSQFQRRRPGGLTRRCACRPLGFIKLLKRLTCESRARANKKRKTRKTFSAFSVSKYSLVTLYYFPFHPTLIFITSCASISFQNPAVVVGEIDESFTVKKRVRTGEGKETKASIAIKDPNVRCGRRSRKAAQC